MEERKNQSLQLFHTPNIIIMRYVFKICISYENRLSQLSPEAFLLTFYLPVILSLKKFSAVSISSGVVIFIFS